jgi:hypothetical protein
MTVDGESRMNDSLRDQPATDVAMTAVAAVDCPKCAAQLRLLRPATLHTPIACCICGATFYMQPIETAPMTDANGKSGQSAGSIRPAFHAASPPQTHPHDRAARSSSTNPGEMTTPAPPPPSPGTRSAPGMPKPVELPDHMQRGFRTRWLESVLGAVLVLLIVVAVCAGGFVLLRAIRFSSSSPVSPAEGKADAAAGDQAPTNSTAPGGDSQTTVPAVTGFKPLPRPNALTGLWESRLDDGGSSCFVFRQDGTAVIVQNGDPPPPPSFYNWFLVDHKGDDLVIDIGPDFGQMGNTRLTVRLTSADAFTMVRHMRAGVVMPDFNLRYVRAGPAPAEWPPPRPASEFVGPPAPPRPPVKPPAPSP